MSENRHWAFVSLNARSIDPNRADEDRLKAAQALLSTGLLFEEDGWVDQAVEHIKALALSSDSSDVFLECVSTVLELEAKSEQTPDSAPFFVRGIQ